MKNLKGLTVDKALSKLEATRKEIPKNGNLNPDPFIVLQDRVANLTILMEALLDILKAFDIINTDILNIAGKNVMQFDQIKGDNTEILIARSNALKARLAAYSKAKRAEPKKGG